jgi:hypothetical protein
MRILVAVAPTMYRETLAHVIRRDRPDDDVRLADPQALDREASSFGPHLIVCTDDAPKVRGIIVPSWIVSRRPRGWSCGAVIVSSGPVFLTWSGRRDYDDPPSVFSSCSYGFVMSLMVIQFSKRAFLTASPLETTPILG